MGAYACRIIKNNHSDVHNTPTWHKKKDLLVAKKKPMLTSVSYDLPATKPKTLTQLSNQSQQNDVFREQLIKQSSHEPAKKGLLTNVRFLLVDLENRMDRTSKAMLRILETFMVSELMMVKNVQQLEQIRANENLRIFLFTSAECANSLGKISSVGEKIFVLRASINPVYKTFENIQDLIFQVAEEFAECCREEAHQDEKLGEFTLAACKRETINEMYRQLMDISTEKISIETLICTDTSLIWLTQNRNAANEEKLLQIAPSLIVFDNEQACWNHVEQCDDETAIFLLVDPNCTLSLVERLEGLAQVKQLYHTEKFLDINELCFRLTHDLIKHYGQLGDQLEAERRNQEARQMFLRARQLCQILFL